MKNEKEMFIINTAKEACEEKNLFPAVMKIYNSMPALYDRYLEKISRKGINKVSQGAYKGVIKDFDAVVSVYTANYCDEKLCNGDLYEAIEKVVKKRCQPIVKLLHSSRDNGLDEIEESAFEISRDVNMALHNNVVFYLEKKGSLTDEDRALNCALVNIVDNARLMPDQNKTADTRENDIVGFESDDAFFLEMVKSAKDVFNRYLDPTLMSAKAALTRDDSFKELRSTIKQGEAQREMLHPSISVLSWIDQAKEEEPPEFRTRSAWLTNLNDALTKGAACFNLDLEYFKMAESDADFMFLEALIANLYRYQTEGIDLIGILYNSPRLKEKQIRRICSNAYQEYEALKGKSEKLIYYSEQIKIVNCAVKDLISAVLLEERKDIVKSSRETKSEAKAGKTVKTSKDTSTDRLLDTINELTSKNTALEKEMENLEKEKARLKKQFAEEIHECDQEIIRLKEKYESEEEKEEEPEEVTEESAPNEEVDKMTPEEFDEFITKNRILVWGCRPKLEQKLKEAFPKLDFVESHKKITNIMLGKYDGILIKADYTGHTQYFTVRDMAKNLDIPFICLSNDWNSEERVYEAAKKLDKLM